MTILENVPLAPYTTLGVGGPARWFFRATRESQIPQAVKFARERDLPLFVLGGGSNLLVSDDGFPGLVLQAAIEGQVHSGLSKPRNSFVDFDVPAGMDWDNFVLMTCKGRYTGVECLAGIPGTVGGSPVQNIGAYGQEVSQTITSVRVFDLVSLAMRNLSSEECAFSYRTSVFNSTHRNRFIVCRVTFQFPLDGVPEITYADLKKHFSAHPNPTPIEVYEAVRAIRRRKGMLILPEDFEGADTDFRSAGSFFKNPVVLGETLPALAARANCALEQVPHYPAGRGYVDGSGMVKLSAAWLIERAGFNKGFSMGRAGLSSRHVLAIVNRGGATAAEVVALRDAVVQGVQERFKIVLEQEPVMLGFSPR